MRPCKTMKEFVLENGKEVTRIVTFVARTFDKGKIADYTQTFYLDSMRKGLLEKYDWSLPDPVASFSKYVFKAIENSVRSSKRTDLRYQGSNFITTVGADDSDSTCIFEVVPLARSGAHTTLREKSSNHSACFRVNSRCNYSVFDEAEDQDFFKILEEFEKQMAQDTTLSVSTKALVLDYLTLSSDGMKASAIAKKYEVSPAYITSVRKMVAAKFNKLRENMENCGSAPLEAR
jgi:hypothetical protein